MDLLASSHTLTGAHSLSCPCYSILDIGVVAEEADRVTYVPRFLDRRLKRGAPENKMYLEDDKEGGAWECKPIKLFTNSSSQP